MDTRTLLLAALLGTGTATAAGAAAAQDAPDPSNGRAREIRDEHGRRCWQDDGPVLRSGPTWTCEDAEGRRERVRVRPRSRSEAGSR